MPNRAGVVPFRWDVRRREQLGRLLEVPLPERAPGSWKHARWGELLPEVRAASARVLARAGDARLVFVGRSPENLFDYLTGALADTGWADRCDLLSVSPGATCTGRCPGIWWRGCTRTSAPCGCPRRRSRRRRGRWRSWTS